MSEGARPGVPYSPILSTVGVAIGLVLMVPLQLVT